MLLFVSKIIFLVATAAIIWVVGWITVVTSPGLVAKATGGFILLVAVGYTFVFVPAAIRREAEEIL